MSQLTNENLAQIYDSYRQLQDTYANKPLTIVVKTQVLSEYMETGSIDFPYDIKASVRYLTSIENRQLRKDGGGLDKHYLQAILFIEDATNGDHGLKSLGLYDPITNKLSLKLDDTYMIYNEVTYKVDYIRPVEGYEYGKIPVVIMLGFRWLDKIQINPKH